MLFPTNKTSAFVFALAGQLDFGWYPFFKCSICTAESFLCRFNLLFFNLYFRAISWVFSQCWILEAVGAQRHLSRKVSSAGTQSAMGGAWAGTAEQQWLLLEAAVSPPGAVGGKQVVRTLLRAGATYPETKKESSFLAEMHRKASALHYSHRTSIVHFPAIYPTCWLFTC